MSDIGERVKKIVVEHLGVEADKVTEGASFIDDLGADSLDTVELVMAFEEEFGCEIPGRRGRDHSDRRRRGQVPRDERQELMSAVLRRRRCSVRRARLVGQHFDREARCQVPPHGRHMLRCAGRRSPMSLMAG